MTNRFFLRTTSSRIPAISQWLRHKSGAECLTGDLDGASAQRGSKHLGVFVAAAVAGGGKMPLL